MFKRLLLIAVIVVAFVALTYQFMYVSKEVSKTPLPSNIELRAAMDVGSGSTGMKVVQYDLAKHKVVKLVFDEQRRVPYMRHLEISKDNRFDPEVMQMGISAIKEFKQIADDLGVKKVVAIATAAFRKAANGEEFANEIKKETGVDFYIIDQVKEGELGFEGAAVKADLTPESALNSIVWDIGGGSVQLTAQKNDGSFIVGRGEFASDPFKLYIIGTLQKKDVQTVHSPNPISESQKEEGLKKVMEVASKIDAVIVDKLKEEKVKVLAVGDLFYYGIRGTNHGNPVVTQADLEKEIAHMIGKSDEDLGGSFADVRVSNAILVLGYMKQLGIQQVEILDVNNSDGGVVDPQFWTN